MHFEDVSGDAVVKKDAITWKPLVNEFGNLIECVAAKKLLHASSMKCKFRELDLWARIPL